MNNQLTFLVVEWLEQGTMDIAGQRYTQQGRQICTPADYPRKLPCHNPDCKGGGFVIGNRIAAFLAAGEYSDHNSLICLNAIQKDRSRRCLHTIMYSITRVQPYAPAEPVKAEAGRSPGLTS
jgi:hypothetical protein